VEHGKMRDGGDVESGCRNNRQPDPAVKNPACCIGSRSSIKNWSATLRVALV
jgi:hypothetical protein